MPLHLLYCPASLYTAEDKQQIVQAITDLYATGRLRCECPATT